jgi:hypothetical protein
VNITADQLLAIVALVNAIGGVVALIIHALRVPYRESAATEQIAAADSMIRVRRAHDAHVADLPPPPPPPNGPATR